jgi:excisionase family DNA binding protein
MRRTKARLMDEVLTVREVATLLKINEKTAYKLAARGEIPGFKVGGSWRFEKAQLEEWMKSKTSKTKRQDES